MGYFDIVLIPENLSTGETAFTVHCNTLGISSQGMTIEEAKKNIKEAIHLYLEENPEYIEDATNEPPTFSFVEVSRGKATGRIRERGCKRASENRI